MIPYIAILIVIIVAVLFTAYKTAEAFEIRGITVTESTTIGALLDYAQTYLDLNTSLKDRLEAAQEFDETPTETLLKDLGMSYSTMADGTFYTEKPFSKALLGQITMDTDVLSKLIAEIEKDLASGKIRKTMSVRDLVRQMNTGVMAENEPIDVSFFNQVITNQVKSSNTREAYLNKKLGSVKIAGVNSGDLAGAFGGAKEALKSSTLSEIEKAVDLTKPKAKDLSENEVAPTVSLTMTQEVEDRIARKVASQVKDTVLFQRATTDMNAMPCPYASYTSDATAQGTDYTQAKPHPGPDMSQYIRKDSIPCWNCDVP
jgi:hypothetical protein